MNTNTSSAIEAPFFQLINGYLSANDIAFVQQAAILAAQIHDGYKRLNDDPYIDHVLAVATILASWQAPAPVLIAGLLHDVFKENYATVPKAAHIEAMFGDTVARLVTDISRLGRLGPGMHTPQALDTQQDETKQLPWVAMVLQRSPLAVVIKLADKLHNFQSLHVLSEQRRLDYASNVIGIFVPFAERLGMRRVRRTLADKAFCVMQPETYQAIMDRYPLSRREERAAPLLSEMTALLADAGLSAQVTAVPRSAYDLFRLETEKGDTLSLTATQTAVVVTQNEADCYRALGALHRQWTPQANQIRDFIANPKANGYRALHTRLHVTKKERQVVAIRDHTMNLVANYGLTAAWQGVDEALLPSFTEWKEPPPGKITVLTPEGEQKILPEAATPIDFAYAVHIGLGHQCTGALVNGRQASLSQPLQTGDVVHILTGKTNVGPSHEWLSTAKTSRARSAVRRWLKNEKPHDAAEKGWVLLESHLHRQDIILSSVQAAGPLGIIAEQLGYDSHDDLLVAVGLQQRDAAKIAAQLRDHLQEEMLLPAMQASLSSLSDANQPQRLAKCCHPAPPDPIVGYVTKRNGVTIHRADCPRVRRLKPLMQADWNAVNVHYQLELQLECADRRGLVHDVSRVVKSLDANMTSFHADRLAGGAAYIQIGLGDLQQEHRDRLIVQLRQVPDVHRVFVRGSRPANSNMDTRRSMHLARNPYTLRPVAGEAFYGRRAELRELIDNLRSVGPGEAVLLWGPRRIGKTSLLLQFQQSVMNSDDYILAFIDMQRLSGGSVTMFLRDVIKAIIDSLDQPKLRPPNLGRMKRDPLNYFRGFLEHTPALKNKHLVLILDEFQLMTGLIEKYVPISDVNRYFRSLIQHQGGFSVIFSGGGVLEKLLALPETSFMLEVARHQKVGCLDRSDARELIIEPAQQLRYEDTVVTRLLHLTAGHPYYLQWLCGELVARANRAEQAGITENDLDVLLAEWLPEQGEQFFNHLWGSASGFNVQQCYQGKLLLTALAYCAPDDRWTHVDTLSSDKVRERLDDSRVWHVLQDLVKMDTLERQNEQYRFKMPLAARWMRANYTVAHVLKEGN